MPKSVDADIRRIVVRILLTQIGVGVVIALGCLLAWNARVAVSALAGAAIGVIANLFMTLKTLQPAPTPRAAFRRVWVGQLLKFVLTVALFVAAARTAGVSLPALFGAYAAMLVVYWWNAAARSRNAAAK